MESLADIFIRKSHTKYFSLHALKPLVIDQFNVCFSETYQEKKTWSTPLRVWWRLNHKDFAVDGFVPNNFRPRWTGLEVGKFFADIEVKLRFEVSFVKFKQEP